MSLHRSLVQQILDERLRIERLALEEKKLIEEYKQKISSMKLEEMEFKAEIDRIRQVLDDPNSVDNKAISDNPQLMTLKSLQNQRASRINNYNKLILESQ